jgi:hypothetical protein
MAKTDTGVGRQVSVYDTALDPLMDEWYPGLAYGG